MFVSLKSLHHAKIFFSLAHDMRTSVLFDLSLLCSFTFPFLFRYIFFLFFKNISHYCFFPTISLTSHVSLRSCVSPAVLLRNFWPLFYISIIYLAVWSHSYNSSYFSLWSLCNHFCGPFVLCVVPWLDTSCVHDVSLLYSSRTTSILPTLVTILVLHVLI